MVVVGSNVLARRHAQAFLRFEVLDDGTRTPPPERLSVGEKLDVLVNGVTISKAKVVRSPEDLGLAFATIEVKTDDGEILSVWRIPPVESKGVAVLFHGYARAKDSLLEAAAGLVELGYTCYLVDFRGSGDSSATYTTVGVHEARDVRAVIEFIEEHQPSAGPLVLYGVSMGAAAVVRALAVEQVEADAAILDAPFDRVLSTVRNRFESMGVPAFPAAELLVFWSGHAFGFDGFDHNPVDYAASVTIPTLIVHGRDDPRARPADVRRVYTALAGPKRIVGFVGVGHEQIAVVRAEEWRSEVGTFLSVFTGS